MYYDELKCERIKKYGERYAYAQGRVCFNRETGRYALSCCTDPESFYVWDGFHCNTIIEFERDGQLITDKVLARIPGRTRQSWYLKNTKFMLSELEKEWIKILC